MDGPSFLCLLLLLVQHNPAPITQQRPHRCHTRTQDQWVCERCGHPGWPGVWRPRVLPGGGRHPEGAADEPRHRGPGGDGVDATAGPDGHTG